MKWAGLFDSFRSLEVSFINVSVYSWTWLRLVKSTSALLIRLNIHSRIRYPGLNRQYEVIIRPPLDVLPMPTCDPFICFCFCLRVPSLTANENIFIHITSVQIEIFSTIYFYLYFMWRCGPTRATASTFLRFLDHTQRRITVGRTPLDEWSARRRDLYLTTHNTHNRETSMPPVGFEPTIPASERPQTHTLDRCASGTGCRRYCGHEIQGHEGKYSNIYPKIVQVLVR